MSPRFTAVSYTHLNREADSETQNGRVKTENSLGSAIFTVKILSFNLQIVQYSSRSCAKTNRDRSRNQAFEMRF